MRDRLLADRDPPLAVAQLRIAQGPHQQLAQVMGLQRLQAEQARAAHQRLVHLEERVLRGGADQGDGAVLDPRQQSVLLGGVEAVHLVDEQQAAQSVLLQPPLGRLHLGAQVLHAGEHGVEAAEVGAGAGGDDPGQGRLPHPGRPMQDQVADPIGGDGAAQQPARPEDLLLPLELIERARPQSIRQRCQPAAQLIAVVAEQIAQTGCSSGQRCASPSSDGNPSHIR